MLEEIVLARIRIQHPDNVVSPKAIYSSDDLSKLPRVFFVDETERELFSDIEESERLWLFPPRVHVTKEKLMSAITEVEESSGWLETQITSRI